MKLLVISLRVSILMTLVSCSTNTVNETVAEIAIEAIADVDISYNEAQCPRVKNDCGVHGHYEEWEQANGKVACACNK